MPNHPIATARRARAWHALGRVPDGIALLIDHAKPVRIPLWIVLVGGVVALGVDQVAELFLIALWIDPQSGAYLWLLAGSTLNGLAVWYAARHAYRLIYPRWPALQDPRASGLRDWLPRLMGAAVPLLLVIGYGIALASVPHAACAGGGACSRRWWRAFGLVLEALLLIAFFVTRRRMVHAWCARRGRRTSLALTAGAEPRVARLRALGSTPLRIFLAAMGVNVLATVGVTCWPQLLDGIGPLAILLIAASFMCLSGGFLCMAADRRGIPLISLLLLASVLLHVLHLNDNHRVRQYATMSTHQRPAALPVDTRPRLDAYANAWLDDRCDGRARCPVVLVSAEGGGIRAAAWTSLVLARLTAQVAAAVPEKGGEPLLARYLFAGSGVSGGSLGLATYVALLRQPRGADPAALEQRSRILLTHDFLAPTLANMLFVDFTQRWLPGAWFDDRARALTLAWEHAARQQGVDAFAAPFAALYVMPDGSVDTGSPALFLNSTTVAEGRRFIEHPFQPIATPQRQPWSAAFDGSAWLDPRVPLSEAVLNSARFTYLSPAGTLQTAGERPPVPATLQLVDGGYFENSGATTLLEVMRQLRAIAAQRGQALRFIVLHISNDATLPDFVEQHDEAHFMPLYSSACPAQPIAMARSESGEVAAPLKALLDTRSARGDYARVQLLRALHVDNAEPSRGDMLWHFRLCPGRYPIPLGWTLSTPVFAELQRQLQQNYPLEAMAKTLSGQLSEALDVAPAETPAR
jgi:hypothetical protein